VGSARPGRGVATVRILQIHPCIQEELKPKNDRLQHASFPEAALPKPESTAILLYRKTKMVNTILVKMSKYQQEV